MTPYTLELHDDIAQELAALSGEKQCVIVQQINAFVTALLRTNSTGHTSPDLPPLTAHDINMIREGIADARMDCVLQGNIVLPELYLGAGLVRSAAGLPNCIFTERGRQSFSQHQAYVLALSTDGGRRFTRALDKELQALCQEVAAPIAHQLTNPVFDDDDFFRFALPVYQRCFTVKTQHHRANCEVWRLFYTLQSETVILLAVVVAGAEHLDEWLLSDEFGRLSGR